MSNCQISALRALRRVSAWKQCPNRYRVRMNPAFSCQIHSGNVQHDKSIDDKMSQTPYPFMSSLKGNIQSRQETFEYEEEEWKHQGLVIFGSISAFMIYFLLLRKEREVDQAIAEQLYKGLPALEVHDLRKAIKKGKAEGQDTSKLEERLKVVLSPPQNRHL